MVGIQRCLVEALEAATRAELRQCANSADALREIQDSFASVLSGELDENTDFVTQLAVRASLAAAIDDVVPRLMAECERP